MEVPRTKNRRPSMRLCRRLVLTAMVFLGTADRGIHFVRFGWICVCVVVVLVSVSVFLVALMTSGFGVDAMVESQE